MKRGNLHQFLTGATAGDAITGQALIIRRWLREWGFNSHIYAQHIHESAASEVRHISSYRKGSDWAVYHHSIGSDLPPFLAKHKLQLILIYHNITPVKYFERNDPGRAQLARLGLQQLRDLRPNISLGIADSKFNTLDLDNAGYSETHVLPITLRPQVYDLPDNKILAQELKSGGQNLLFVGRLAPNKKQEDLIRLLYYLRRVAKNVRLFLVGDRWEVGYDTWLENMADALHVSDALILTGKVSQRDLATYYRHSSLYVSMSDHEGFGVPLIESMYFGLPVMAYAVSAVPDTMGRAGLLFYEKDFERLAELADMLLRDQPLRERMIKRQQQQVQIYLEPNVRRKFQQYIENVGLIPQKEGEAKR